MVILTNNISSEVSAYLSAHKYDGVFVLTDTNTKEQCLPLLGDTFKNSGCCFITIEAGDIHKNIHQATAIWTILSQSGASRHSLLINVGGGMVTDLGGFAGACFKRGIHILHIPTTLMASVDAAVGGKTGINYNGFKNEIGSFYQPDCVMIDCRFLKTLDRANLLSGYAEMIKHGLISDAKSFYDILDFDIEHPDFEKLNELVGVSIAIKERFVEADFKETGQRKALNMGHTVGHAFESLSFSKNRPILHGQAVAGGMICELYLSHKVCELPAERLRQVTNLVKAYYTPFTFDCGDYERIYKLMTHDKKNKDGHIHFALLGDIGDVRINQTVDKALVLESFDFYRENT